MHTFLLQKEQQLKLIFITNTFAYAAQNYLYR